MWDGAEIEPMAADVAVTRARLGAGNEGFGIVYTAVPIVFILGMIAVSFIGWER